MARPPELPTGLEAVDLKAAAPAQRLALSEEAGWNQTRADWDRMLRLGQGFGVAERDGPLVASAILLPYESSIAWISMVLVTARWRRRGLASLLMGRALEGCRALQRTAFLDATPEGAEVYRGLGFLEGERILRFHRPAGDLGAAPAPGAGPGGSWAEACARDARALGAPRRPLLDALAADGLQFVAAHGSLLLRPGRIAWQLGPLVADNRVAARALLAEGLLALEGRPAFADLREGADLEQDLIAAGFTPQRRFLRMHLGAPPPSEPGLLWLTAGPEFG